MQRAFETWRHTLTHGGEWRENWRMEWVASTLILPRNLVYPALLTLMRTPRLPVVDWTEAPADLNELVRIAERPNLVSARVPSCSKRTLHQSQIRGAELQSRIVWVSKFYYLLLCSLWLEPFTIWLRSASTKHIWNDDQWKVITGCSCKDLCFLCNLCLEISDTHLHYQGQSFTLE